MIILDSETTGLLKPSLADIGLQPYMTEFYACKLDNKTFDLIDEIETFVKPPVPMPEEVIKITGITDEMVKDAPTFLQLYDRLYDFFLGETIVVAHNAMFDMGVLRYELTRHDFEFKFPWPKDYVCTIELSKPIRNRRLKLTDLHQIATGKPHMDKAHRAKEDVYALVRCFHWLVEQGYYTIPNY